MEKLFQRAASGHISSLLGYFPAVGIVGPRQVGKTTLAKMLADASEAPWAYLDLEDDRDRQKLATDPHFFFQHFEDQCIILDEVQQMPEIFRTLRGAIDANRRPGRFILLGSASPELLRQSSETLAGRIGYVELYPFNLLEIDDPSDWKAHWFRGGFPGSYLAPNDDLSLQWRKNFIKTYIERDLPQLGLSADPLQVRRFWQMLAAQHGNLWNAEQFANSLGVSGHTIKRYLGFLESAFMIHSLQPWFTNVGKRLVKSPKVYLRDSGILHAWFDFAQFDNLLGNTILGASWEGYVIEQIKSAVGDKLECFFYRTQQGAECDLVLVKGGAPIAAIEIKFSSAPTVSKGFYISIDDVQTAQNFVIVPQTEDYPLKEGVWVVSLSSFLEKHLPELI